MEPLQFEYQDIYYILQKHSANLVMMFRKIL